MEKKTTNLIGLALGLAALFATVWVVGKGWKISQQ